MLKRIDFRLVLGALLILAGGLGFLQAFGLLQNASDVFWGLIFLAGGAVFLTLFVGGQWWAVIPGLVLAGIGVLILLPEALQDLGGAVFLGAIGLSFWVVYLSARERWWAIIPGGIVSTLAIVSAVPEKLAGIETGSIFFFGLALTFLLVAWLAGQTWGYWPAAGLGVFGVFLLVTSRLTLASYFGAAALILGGVFIILRSLFARE
jgi:hypothetical protein